MVMVKYSVKKIHPPSVDLWIVGSERNSCRLSLSVWRGARVVRNPSFAPLARRCVTVGNHRPNSVTLRKDRTVRHGRWANSKSGGRSFSERHARSEFQLSHNSKIPNHSITTMGFCHPVQYLSHTFTNSNTHTTRRGN